MQNQDQKVELLAPESEGAELQAVSAGRPKFVVMYHRDAHSQLEAAEPVRLSV